MQQRLRPGLQALGHRVQDVGDLVHPAALLASAGEHVPQRRPSAERAVAAHQARLVETAIAQIAQHGGPGVGALAVAVFDCEQLLHAVLAHADHDQQAQPVVLAKTDRDMHAITEQVGVAVKAQAAGAELLVL
jgi:hypothetical protein